MGTNVGIQNVIFTKKKYKGETRGFQRTHVPLCLSSQTQKVWWTNRHMHRQNSDDSDVIPMCQPAKTGESKKRKLFH